MESVFLVDIDGVLAKGHLQKFMALCNDLLQLAIPVKELVSIVSLKAFSDLPQVVAHKKRVGIKRYRNQISLVRWHPLYVMGCLTIDGATDGVQYLAQRFTLHYCTARYIEFDPDWNAKVVESTKHWLLNNEFPCANDVIFCTSPREKLTTIVAMIQTQKQPVYLIDDSLDMLLDAFKTLSMPDQELLQAYLTFVAFDYCLEECDQLYPCRVVPMESWQDVHQLTEKEFHHV